MNAYDTFDTPVGPFTVAVNDAGAVIATAFGRADALFSYLGMPLDDLHHEPARVEHVGQQLNEYFSGRRQEFELQVAPSGTPYQQRVWRALRDIPFGNTRTYGELASQLGTSPRAVGGANGANRVCLIVPCHRVIGTDGSLTGYAYGNEIKQFLLDHEVRVAEIRAAQPVLLTTDSRSP